MKTSVESLIELQAIVEQHAAPEVAEWFSAGLMAYFNGARLDEALALNAEPCRRRPSTEYATRLRNRHICRAGEIALPDAGPSARAERLAREIRDFQSRLWPRWRGNPNPPQGASALRSELFVARTYHALPESPRQLYEILRPKLQ